MSLHPRHRFVRRSCKATTQRMSSRAISEGFAQTRIEFASALRLSQSPREHHLVSRHLVQGFHELYGIVLSRLQIRGLPDHWIPNLKCLACGHRTPSCLWQPMARSNGTSNFLRYRLVRQGVTSYIGYELLRFGKQVDRLGDE